MAAGKRRWPVAVGPSGWTVAFGPKPWTLAGGARWWTGLVLMGALVVPSVGTAQDSERLAEAVDYYHQHATSDLKRIQEATHRFEAISIDLPVLDDPETGWLPAYWTSFAYTQLSLFAGDERSRPYADLARVYFENAAAGMPEGDPRIEADFHALEAMVLGFERRAYPERAEELDAAATAAWDRAREADPDNPMAAMNRGLTLIPNEGTRLEAYRHLDRAIELYEPRMQSTLPNWGREFIDVWMGNYPRPTGSDGGTTDLRTTDLLASRAESWAVRQDQEGVGDRPSLVREGDGLRVTTGGSSVIVPPSDPVSGSYRVELVVSQFDPAGRNEGFGLVFGGSELSGAGQTYGYFLIRQDGMTLVKRRAGSRTPVVRDWERTSNLRGWADRPDGRDTVTNMIAVDVDEGVARLLVNGEEVDRLPAGAIPTDGMVGLRVNHGLDVRLERFVLIRRGDLS